MELQVGVKILLKNAEGKYLLLERNLDKYASVGKENRWDIVGGRIIPGTSLMQNLKREIFEEIRLDFKEEPALIAAQDILLNDKHVVRLTYLGVIEGEPKLDSDHVSFKWFLPEELIHLEGLDKYFKSLLQQNLIKF
jgi:ADP-ribose pyrophosphatase YjhB (NUDIX family)